MTARSVDSSIAPKKAVKKTDSRIALLLTVLLVCAAIPLLNNLNTESPSGDNAPFFVSDNTQLSSHFSFDPLDINTATAEQMTILPGIGPKSAEKIIRYREKHGSFHSFEELNNVQGIGKQTVNNLKPFITL